MDEDFTDTLTPSERSERMSRIRGKDSTAELRLRRMIHGMGYRYRLHVKDLPGTPDLVFRSRKAVIFMHGCFWHRHHGCALARLPKSKRAFWEEKLNSNKERDNRNQQRLVDMGWKVMVIWECEMQQKDLAGLAKRIKHFLIGNDGENRDEIR
ncbi:very short patch repair endonuclease [Thiorhodovibrio winogradskyi]|uniref:very short patch repair endonuclease n=1 Tax=Thiorhodovibrio winogradskyi TaxID=77007 RepID=UPI002E27B4E8|nr:very short patch repair endonuclease [Thiorhodovibrio winogradskyi]